MFRGCLGWTKDVKYGVAKQEEKREDMQGGLV